MQNILICDDERDIVSALKIYLTAEGYNTFEAYTGEEALEILEREDICLAILDIMMPGLDGINVTARLRESMNIPVILLTAKSEDTDKVLGLNIGADDYVTKPFNPVELMARVRAQLRRFTRLGSMASGEKKDIMSVEGLELDDAAKTVTKDGESVPLTPTEYDILKLLMNSPGKVFSMSQIYEAVWGDSPMGGEGTVAVHIRHLREKIELDPSEPRQLKVVWGKGYKLERGR